MRSNPDHLPAAKQRELEELAHVLIASFRAAYGSWQVALTGLFRAAFVAILSRCARIAAAIALHQHENPTPETWQSNVGSELRSPPPTKRCSPNPFSGSMRSKTRRELSRLTATHNTDAKMRNVFGKSHGNGLWPSLPGSRSARSVVFTRTIRPNRARSNGICFSPDGCRNSLRCGPDSICCECRAGQHQDLAHKPACPVPAPARL